MNQLTTIILAAGKGTRMKSDLPKVLNPILGRPMIDWVIETAKNIKSDQIILVVGHQKELVIEKTSNKASNKASNLKWVTQEPQLGTGHAVQQCISELMTDGDVLVLSGDVPLIREETLNQLREMHQRIGASATVLATDAEDPTGYGRIIRFSDTNTTLERIVEEKDLPNDEMRAIREVNCGIYIFKARDLIKVLPLLSNQNHQQEYYLTEVMGLLVKQRLKVAVMKTNEMSEAHGVNTKEQLIQVEKLIHRQLKEKWPNPDYLVIERYLDEESCDWLVQYFRDNIGRERLGNVNPEFSGRTIYWEKIRNNSELKALMKAIQDDVRRRLKEFYHESGGIWPEATHLVKWPEGKGLGDHADNAYADGRPNYVNWRTYSAVLYLNDDFEGGEFYFRDKPIEIQPKKGTLVAFTAGMDHVHGVRKVTRGTRYAMPMWFCGDSARELAYPEYRVI